MNEQNRNRIIGTENRWMVARAEGGGGWEKKVKGLRRRAVTESIA